LGGIPAARVWRARGVPDIGLTDVTGVDPDTKPWEEGGPPLSTYPVWRESILIAIPAGDVRDAARKRLSALDPESEEPKDVLRAEFWKKARPAP
jgi:hypothetical protein